MPNKKPSDEAIALRKRLAEHLAGKDTRIVLGVLADLMAQGLSVFGPDETPKEMASALHFMVEMLKHYLEEKGIYPGAIEETEATGELVFAQLVVPDATMEKMAENPKLREEFNAMNEKVQAIVKGSSGKTHAQIKAELEAIGIAQADPEDVEKMRQEIRTRAVRH